MNQHEFTDTAAGASQNQLILEHLMAHRGSWVPMPQLLRVSGAYAVHSRISDLRGMGYAIMHRNEHKGRTVASFYMLLPEDFARRPGAGSGVTVISA